MDKTNEAKSNVMIFICQENDNFEKVFVKWDDYIEDYGAKKELNNNFKIYGIYEGTLARNIKFARKNKQQLLTVLEAIENFLSKELQNSYLQTHNIAIACHFHLPMDRIGDIFKNINPDTDTDIRLYFNARGIQIADIDEYKEEFQKLLDKYEGPIHGKPGPIVINRFSIGDKDTPEDYIIAELIEKAENNKEEDEEKAFQKLFNGYFYKPRKLLLNKLRMYLWMYSQGKENAESNIRKCLDVLEGIDIKGLRNKIYTDTNINKENIPEALSVLKEKIKEIMELTGTDDS